MESTLIIQPQWSFDLRMSAAFVAAFLLLLWMFSWLDRSRSAASLQGSETSGSDEAKDERADGPPRSHREG
jgi:hypothetical protein